jgi:hypothetical protein
MDVKVINQHKITRQEYNDIIALKNKAVPGKGVVIPAAIVKRNYPRRFFNLVKALSLRNGKLFFHQYPLIVDEDIEKTLNELYNNPRTSANSRDAFYILVKDRYVGISRRVVNSFLNKQESYQMNRQLQINRHEKPINAKERGIRRQIDLIDFRNVSRQNSNYNWILTIIDVFSRYAWAYPLKNKSAEEVLRALKLHCETEGNGHPHIWQADNGSEFKSVVERYLNRHSKLIHSTAYKPSTQGKIERLNKTIKSRLFANMARDQTKRWVDYLSHVVELYNNSYHTQIKTKPIIAHNDERYKPIINALTDKQNKKTFHKHPPLPAVKKGDEVRLAYTVFIEGRRDATFRKGYLPNWSKELYTVETVSKGNIPQYTVSLDGEMLAGVRRRHELLLVDEVVRKNNVPVVNRRRDNRGRLIRVYNMPEVNLVRGRSPRAALDPLNLIGKRIEVKWPDNWYPGTVTRYSLIKGYVVRYDDLVAKGENDPELFESGLLSRETKYREI